MISEAAILHLIRGCAENRYGIFKDNPAGTLREKYVYYKYDHITHQNTWSFRYHGGSRNKGTN